MAHSGAQVAPSADVDERATIGDGSKIWHLAQVREDAQVGRNCVIGRGAYVGPGVRLGDNVKLQNYALVYEPAQLADGVFIGPAVVLTNDEYPRAVTPRVVSRAATTGRRSVSLSGKVPRSAPAPSAWHRSASAGGHSSPRVPW
ncbi:hypothetical protein Pflav_084230 [Phytohabitans flavus]|uniref:N-acetyltransferase n=1 Tax=Phytohabitans flavus TaxID=1076124 RepID=A0A6F8Y7L3_9ACTN|nr:DapH/DapD/GlmU-related protein [Phytohabitans flavus]BCB82013.1 hypothetical protein Pflav_084230 [Phytohabitans flavus]